MNPEPLPAPRCAWLGIEEAPLMTVQCAWCWEVLGVNLVALARSGLSHGICWGCLPRWLGRGK